MFSMWRFQCGDVEATLNVLRRSPARRRCTFSVAVQSRTNWNTFQFMADVGTLAACPKQPRM
jgi:hypothetical protein